MPPSGVRCEPVDPFRNELGVVTADFDGDPLSSENVVVDEVGDVMLPQPKKLPSERAPGDLGSLVLLLFVVVVFVSLSTFREFPLFGSLSCGACGFLENRDSTVACCGADD